MDSRLGNLSKAGKVLVLGKRALSASAGNLDHAAHGLAKEAKTGPQLHQESMTALRRMTEMSSSLKKTLNEAYGYAIFPSVAKSALVVGVTYGKGEVFAQGKVIGYAGIVQVTAGVQLGGQTLHVLVILDDKKALDRLKGGKLSFAANASVGIVKTGANAAKGPYGLRVLMYPEGGEMLEASIGAQKIKFVPAALGRLRKAA